MLLSSFDNGSFIIPTLKDGILSEVYLIYSKIPLSHSHGTGEVPN
jgi:hypothetical protein